MIAENRVKKLYRHVILDRDGVLNKEAPGGYVLSVSQWEWLPGVLEALSVLCSEGLVLSVASNQSCVGRGMIDLSGLEKVHEKMKKDASEKGVFFSGIYFCPHAPGEGCSCRKPEPGLLEQAVKRAGISREETVFIGDSERDLRAALSAGVAAWLVRTGKGTETESALRKEALEGIEPGHICVFDDLRAACRALLEGVI